MNPHAAQQWRDQLEKNAQARLDQAQRRVTEALNAAEHAWALWADTVAQAE